VKWKKCYKGLSGEQCKKAVWIAGVMLIQWKYVGSNNSVTVWCSILYLCLQSSLGCMDLVDVPTTMLMHVACSYTGNMK
jgi:hypothetical protein